MERRRGWRPFRSEEYQESDMFELMEDREAIDYTNPRESEQRSIGLVSRQLPSAIMLIPRAKKSSSSSPEPKLVQHSAPVNIPNWSKIYGKSPVGDSSRSSLFNNQDCFDGCCDNDSDKFDGKSYIQNSNDDDDDDDDEMEDRIPPHEWLAKKQRRKQISPFSVCEGAGRTLKGRDLRRVRHAVLTKTGFI